VNQQPHRRLPQDASAPRVARQLIADALSRWDLGELVEEATLITSELVTNAAVRCRQALELVVARTPEGVEICVADDAPGSPRPRAAGPLDTHGRGLQLVEALASEWGTRPGPGGKVVWARLRFSSSSGAKSRSRRVCQKPGRARGQLRGGGSACTRGPRGQLMRSASR